MLDLLLTIIAGIAIAAASSWITVYLSRNKFRSERWWERKVEAYERVIDAFHGAKKFASEHMDALERGREVSKERDTELRKRSRDAKDEIARASDIGRFLLSENALKVLARYEAEADSVPKQEGWYEYLDSSWSVNHHYMKEFIEEAKRDLLK